MKTQTIIPPSRYSLLGKGVKAKEAFGWKLYATGVGIPTLGGKSYLQKSLTAAKRAGYVTDYVLGAWEGITCHWAVVVKPKRAHHQQEKACNHPVPNPGDMLFIYTDKQGRKVPVFAPTAEIADKKAEDAGLSDLEGFKAFALVDVTGIVQ